MGNFEKTCIIDDDAIAVFGLKRVMQALKFSPELIIYENGLDAIEGFQTMIVDEMSLPSLILIDINMPVMDGWDFITEMRKIWPKGLEEPTIYMMTSSLSPMDVETAKSFGLENNYLIKPIYAEVLQDILV
ncbi:response regulator [Zobellia sp. 1_MG-2023]|uniref:response regulator n=1 Tax=Zobellia sp. 1_MG-2023 TaxID=3062626 RepID=UPI0026E1CE64|nr:response regulator [Zobellia sp. 1_MG-2023]MDO6817878.1 response regulator [Zobellia sp. 1_MG-2023]